jgi:hypothetical protein
LKRDLKEGTKFGTRQATLLDNYRNKVHKNKGLLGPEWVRRDWCKPYQLNICIAGHFWGTEFIEAT